MKTTLFSVFLSVVSFASGLVNAQPRSIPFTEKVYLHLNRHSFIAGDIVWIKAYLTGGSGNKLTDNSKTLYVELISPKSQIVTREVVRMDNGTGHCDIKLGDSIDGGHYRIRAYTRYMLNFGNDFIFEKEIGINPKRKQQTATDSIKQASKPEIHFYPESGSLVEGVEGTLAFMATFENGRGCTASGNIVDETDQKICSFASSHLGKGRFSFTPQAKHSYFAEGLAGGKAFRIELRKPLSADIYMHISQTDSVLNVDIKTNDTGFEDFENEAFTLRFEGGGKLYLRKNFELNSKTQSIRILKTAFPAGVVRISLLDKNAKPHCERLAYIDNQAQTDVSFSLSKSPYAGDDSSILKIKLNRPGKACLSLAVSNADAVSANKFSIASYLLVESELRGPIEKPTSYFDSDKATRAERLDLLMLTQGWRDYLWRRFDDSIPKMVYSPEKGLEVKGLVKTLPFGKPYANANITMKIMGAQQNGLNITQTDSAGYYNLGLTEFYGQRKVIISSKDKKNTSAGEIFLDTMYFRYPPRLNLSYRTFDSVQNFGINEIPFNPLKYKKKYKLIDTIPLKAVDVKAKFNDATYDSTAYGGTVISYKKMIVSPADTLYDSYIPYMFCPQNAQKETSYGKDDGRVPKWAIYINGECVYDPYDYTRKHIKNSDLAKDLNMNEISKVEVLNKFEVIPTMKGPVVMRTMRVFITATRDQFERRMYDVINKKISGYYVAREFYQPQAKRFEDDTDTRYTVFWSPEIITNEKGEASVHFLNTAENANLRFTLEGIGLNGGIVCKEMLTETKK